MTGLVLKGHAVRLEPLEHRHAKELAAAAAVDPSLYRWTAVPQTQDEAAKYIALALNWAEAGRAVPFVIVRTADNSVIGSTRYFDIERWAWPPGHPSHGRAEPDACEIGYTWLTRPAIRTAANTEAKLLMLTHAFETWRMVRVCLHTDVRNERSRAAMERMGAKFEGILALASDVVRFHSAGFSALFDRGGGLAGREATSGGADDILIRP